VRQVVSSNERAEEQRYARELERANEELRRVNRELEEFAYIASHDLREPLRMINIYTQLLIRRYEHAFDEEAGHFAQHIQYSVSRMEQLIQDVLQYSQVIHEGSECAVAPVALRSSLEQALAVFQDRLDAAGAQLEIGELPVVAAEETQLALVFQNLLSNALKYADPARILRIRIWAERDGESWTIRFSDNGIGFEPEFAERIFGLFKRLHGRSVPGTGLGLAICRRIVERYDGEIWAEGKVHDGATFVFKLKGWDHRADLAYSACGGQPR
jgi:light-regulated signal transduction histidine kinase (bacteriophytochrome)